LNADLRQHATVGTVGYRLGKQSMLQGSLGAVVAGELEAEGVVHDVAPGFVTSIAVSHQWLKPGAWYVVSSLAISVSTAETSANQAGNQVTGRLTATDLRLSILAGYTFNGIVSPYLLVRGFGGPVFWEDAGTNRTGTDRDHYAVGAGMVVRVGKFGLNISGSAVGERSASAGIDFSF
jgi:hypothetical protein